MEKKSIVYVVIDIVIYVLVIGFGLALAFDAIPSITPFQRGFFCSDESITYPYKEDTVSTDLAAVLATVVPGAFIIAIEVFQRRSGFKFRKIVKPLYRHLGFYLFGEGLCIIVTEVVKLFSGRLRPHFLDVCQARFTSQNCSNGHQGYIENYVCTNSNNELLLNARKSFPSGHASMIIFSMSYLMIYLQFKIKSKYSVCRVFCPVVQTTLFCVALYVSISRVQDNMHHVTDVIGGGILGLAFSLYTVIYLTKLHKDTGYTSCSSNLENTAIQRYSTNKFSSHETDINLESSWNSVDSKQSLNLSQNSQVAIIS
ncbi:hypothetical protein FSP39_019950 [Pinctada imbricata]|uniref:Phosphatidic acid phosphatase type 2/haloperoxidase domain-containing protein n=1 Tax=Pinctada imbricata TaxID=66713 RepID=A0AA88YRZ3_PINIB|nr:hypothetical protein FSP39_019950 [Pinctada imbricata]